MKLIVAGGRDFSNTEQLFDTLYRLYARLQVTEIVSGGARGADRLGEEWAEREHVPCTIFKADWKQHGNGAGYFRNMEMAEYADGLLAFWDGRSKGTRHMIRGALEMPNIRFVEVVKYGPVEE